MVKVLFKSEKMLMSKLLEKTGKNCSQDLPYQVNKAKLIEKLQIRIQNKSVLILEMSQIKKVFVLQLILKREKLLILL